MGNRRVTPHRDSMPGDQSSGTTSPPIRLASSAGNRESLDGATDFTTGIRQRFAGLRHHRTRRILPAAPGVPGRRWSAASIANSRTNDAWLPHHLPKTVSPIPHPPDWPGRHGQSSRLCRDFVLGQPSWIETSGRRLEMDVHFPTDQLPEDTRYCMDSTGGPQRPPR